MSGIAKKRLLEFFFHAQAKKSHLLNIMHAGLTSPGLQEETATTTTTAVTAVGGRSSSWPHFDRIFMISALTGDGVDDLRVCA